MNNMTKYLLLLLLLACSNQAAAPAAHTVPVVPKTKQFPIHWLQENLEDTGYPQCNKEVLNSIFGIPAFLTTGLDPLGVVEWRLSEEGILYPHALKYKTLKDGHEVARAERFGIKDGHHFYVFKLDFQHWDSETRLRSTGIAVYMEEHQEAPPEEKVGFVFIHQLEISDNGCLKEEQQEVCTAQVKCAHKFVAPDFQF
jgi:hypothetical protein